MPRIYGYFCVNVCLGMCTGTDASIRMKTYRAHVRGRERSRDALADDKKIPI